MLDDSEVLAWYARHGCSDRAQSVINHVRCSTPARRVGGGKRNVTGRYPSRKMRVTIQFESHRVELAAIYDLEHDPDVLEYYDQPPTFKLDYQSASGRQLGVLHTADFFVIRKSGAGWEECKTQDELVYLSRQNENRYRSDDETTWRCPPGESYAATHGLYYRVRCSRDIHWVFQRNIQFMEDYFRGDREVPPAVRDVVTAHVSASPGLSLDQLLRSTAHAASTDDIFSLIAAGVVYIDLRTAPLAEPIKVAVFVDQRASALQPVVNTIETLPPGKAPITTIEARLARASENDLSIANTRLRYVSGALRGKVVEDPDAPAGRSKNSNSRLSADSEWLRPVLATAAVH